MAEEITKNNRRQVKNFVLAPNEQLKIAILIFANGFLFTTLLYGGLVFVLSSMFNNLAILIPPSVWMPGPEIESARHQMWISYGLFTLASLLGSALVAIKITHRYLGPMQSMRRYLTSLKDGTIQGPLTLRENDQTELVAEINDLARKLYPEKFSSN